MVRIGGMTYACNPTAAIGKRIDDMRLKGKPIEAGQRYKVAGWAPVAEGATGEPVWDVVEGYLKDIKTIKPRAPNLPRIIGMSGNQGLA
jgi:sulfur-oxidizing protein SoxB